MICPICGKENIKKKPSQHLHFFYKCLNCGDYFHLEGPPPIYEESYFTEEGKPSVFSKIFSPLSNLFLYFRLRMIYKAIGETKWPILDYGCGNAKLVRYLFARGLNIEGFDPSLSAVQLSQKEGAPVFNTIPNKQYEMIMFWHSLEHSDTPQEDIKKCLNFLKPNGKLLIAVPNGDSLEALVGRGNWFCYDWPFHRVHFTPSSLEKMLNNIGLKVISMDHFNPEYTVSSLVQTFLNLFLPKNSLYSALSNRRIEGSRAKLFFLVLISVLLILLFSPLLLLFYFAGLITRRSAGIIVVADLVDR
ncbi:MAG: class I SAM-dependent methyltransferase [bacterium]|nr:class I SAM-dependent methyltransferase [bacterium]